VLHVAAAEVDVPPKRQEKAIPLISALALPLATCVLNTYTNAAGGCNILVLFHKNMLYKYF